MALGQQQLIRLVVQMEDETQTASASVEGNLRSMAGAASSAAGPLGRIAEIAAGVVTARLLMRMADGVRDLASAAIDAVGKYEALSMQIETLLAREESALDPTLSMADALAQGGVAAENMLTWVTQLALASPFSEEDVGYIVRIGMSYGMSSEMAAQMAQALADLGAATGLPAEQMRLLGLALGQVEARGFLTGEEMRQLTNAGVGVDMIARAMNISVSDVADAIKDKQIAAEDLLPALFAIIESDFDGSAARMALSWQGLGSTLSDIGQVVLRTLFTPALEEVKPLIIDVLDRLQDPATREQLADLGHKIGIVVAGAMDTLWNAIQFVTDNWEPFRLAVLAVITALGGFAILTIVALLIGALTSPLGLVALAVSALAVLWASDWGGIQEKTKAVLAAVSDFIGTAMETIGTTVETVIGAVREWWDTNHEQIEATASAVWSAISEVVTAIVNGIASIVTTIVGNVVDFWTENHELIEETARRIWETISGLIGVAVEAISKVVGSVLDAIATFWEEHGEAVVTTVENFFELIRIVVDTVMTLIGGLLKAVMQIINGDWEGAWETVKETVEAVWENIKAVVELAVESVSAGVEIAIGVVEGWITVLKGAWEGIATLTSEVWERIKTAVVTPITEAGAAVGNVVQGILDAFGKIKFPKIPTPHVKVNWVPTGFPGVSYPELHIEWYKKGLNAIIDQPTIIGVGEAGAERVTVTPLTGPRAGKTPGGGGTGDTYVLNYTAIREDPGREDAEESMRRLEWSARMRFAT